MTAAEFLPPGRPSLAKLGAAVQGCRGCELYRDATQAVFGEGPANAKVMTFPAAKASSWPRCIRRRCCAPMTARRPTQIF